MLGKTGKSFIRSVLAGMCIGIGCCVYIGCEVKWVGAVLFAIGLFTILTYGLDLYTGKVGYIAEDVSLWKTMPVIIIGNFVGTLILGIMMPLDGAAAIASNKLNLEYYSVFFRGILCGILMFIAADTFRTGKGPLATFVCVPVFILAGFEHSIADMFYFCSGGIINFEALIFILIVIAGNAAGGMLIPFCRKYMYEEKKKESGTDETG